jgi:hypothetical protein
VRNHLDDTYPGVPLRDISPVLGAMRTVKSPFEIGVMKEAGQIAGAMMAAAHDSLREGAPEYESALAVIEAGSRKAATFLTAKGWERFVSPMILYRGGLPRGAGTQGGRQDRSARGHDLCGRWRHLGRWRDRRADWRFNRRDRHRI